MPDVTEEEHVLLAGLRENRWAVKLRLEQERISWDYAWTRILTLD